MMRPLLDAKNLMTWVQQADKIAEEKLDTHVLLEDYYNLAVFAYFINEKDIQDKIAFETHLHNAQIQFENQNGDDDPLLRTKYTRLVSEKQYR